MFGRFAPDADENSSPYATIGFKVGDGCLVGGRLLNLGMANEIGLCELRSAADDCRSRLWGARCDRQHAKRRAAEGRQDSIAERDRLDSSRKTSPLTCPPGAIDIDSTHLTLDQVVEKMAALIAAKLR